MLTSRDHLLIRSRLLRKLAALSAMASALFPASARAQERVTPGAGMFFGYAFGERTGFEWGLEAFVTAVDAGTGSRDILRQGFGTLAQLGLIGLEQPRMTVALFVGSEVSRPYGGPNTALMGEVGATYRFGTHPGFGIHSGVMLECFLFNVALRRQWLLDDNSVVGGFRFPPTYEQWPEPPVVGRPFRTRRGLARVESRARCIATSCAKVHDESAELAGRAWECDAQHECASVPAFLQLAADLLTHGAPDSLVDRALMAAQDEVLHALLCAELASRYLPERVWPSLPELAGDVPFERSTSLMQIAAESWLDGCLGEGAAAARAARAVRGTGDRAAKAVQARVAVDEARHADLAWAVLDWTIERGGADVRDALRALCDAEVTSGTSDINGLERYGRLGEAESKAAAEQHFSESRSRLDRALGSRA